MKKFLAGLLAALMIFSAAPMTGLAAQAEEWAAAVESAVAPREEADAPTSFGAAVKNAVQSLGRFLQDTVTQLVQQNLQEPFAVTAMLTGAENTAPAANSAGNAVSLAATDGDYTYQVLADGTAEITGYTGSATELVIPSEIDGYPVTSIGDYAFGDCTALTSIVIPDSVTRIGRWAFEHCSSLMSIKIPDSVMSIELAAFKGCSSLTSITIPNSVTRVNDYVFYDCFSLVCVTLGNRVTRIGNYAFSN